MLETIGFGGFGRVLKGEYQGQHVAMKVLYKVQVGAFFPKKVSSLATRTRLVGWPKNRLLSGSSGMAIARA